MNAALDALACGYASAARSEKLLVMVSPALSEGHVAFIDESHGSQSRRVLMLSACVASYDEWRTFSDEWLKALGERPAINAFHMREARTATGNFKGWRRLAIDHKIILLCEVICNRQIHTINCWVDEDDYKETVAAATTADFRHPYHICFHTMVMFIARVQERLGLYTPVDYVFDDKGDTGQEALIWYSAIKEASPPEFSRFMGATPVFRNDEQVLPLQAADIVAWRRRRILESQQARDPELASTMRLDCLTRADVPISRKYLEIMARHTAMVPGVSEQKGEPSIYQQMKSQHRKEQRKQMSASKNEEYESFNAAMDAVLKADPDAVKAAMEAEKQGRAEEAKRAGKRGRGRPPKQRRRSSASSRASS